MQVYRYVIYTSVKGANTIVSNKYDDLKFGVDLDAPIEKFLDDEKSYIRTPKGYIIMKHSIKVIKDLTEYVTEA